MSACRLKLQKQKFVFELNWFVHQAMVVCSAFYTVAGDGPDILFIYLLVQMVYVLSVYNKKDKYLRITVSGFSFALFGII